MESFAKWKHDIMIVYIRVSKHPVFGIFENPLQVRFAHLKSDTSKSPKSRLDTRHIVKIMLFDWSHFILNMSG